MKFRFLSSLSAIAIALMVMTACATATTMTQTAESQASLSPEQVLQALKDGNQRFVEGNMIERDWMSQVKQTASGQYPHSVVLGCVDSRVPPEVVLDQGIGDIFSARVAGNFVNTDILGSMEFATAVAGSKVIVVLGHTACGAVKGACDGVQLGNLTHLLSNIGPALYASRDVPGEKSSKNAAYVQAVVEANVDYTVEQIVGRSAVMRDLVGEGKLLVVGAIHDLETGKITFGEPLAAK